jgi:hypothetical protein
MSTLTTTMSFEARGPPAEDKDSSRPSCLMPECNKWLNSVIRLNTVNDITLFCLSYFVT